MTSILNVNVCNVLTVDGKQYTCTNNPAILGHFGIKPCRDSGIMFDFRSKQYIELKVDDILEICAIDCNESSNPYLNLENTHINYSIEILKRMYKLPCHIFTNSPPDNSFNGIYEFARIAFDHKFDISNYVDMPSVVCAIQDKGAFDFLISNSMYDINKIVCIPHLELLDMDFGCLLAIPEDEFDNHIKTKWINILEEKRKAVLIEKTDLCEKYAVGDSATKKEKIESAFTIDEIKKEIKYYKSLNFVDELNAILYIGDIFKFYPFNDVVDPRIKPVNIWHHRAFKLCRNLFPLKFITYSHIELNNDSLMSELKTLKAKLVETRKIDTLHMLDKEVAMLKTEDAESNKSLIEEIQDIKTLVQNVVSECSEKTVTSVINFWPPILNPTPEEFVL